MERMSEKREEFLLKGLATGDARAFESIVEHYSPKLLRKAVRLTKEVDMAKDLVQDVLVTLWERAGQLNVATSLEAYLNTMLRNRFLREVSRSTLHEKATQQLLLHINQMQESIADILIVAELEQSLTEIVHQLPPNMQRIFVLRNEDYSLREIAEALGLAEQTIKSYHTELKRRIKAALLARHPDIGYPLALLLVSLLTEN